jgi:hypothetical protein
MCEPRHQIATLPDAPHSPYQPLSGVIGSIWGVIVSNRASRACEGYLSVNPTRSNTPVRQTRSTYLLAGCRTMSHTCGSILLATPPAVVSNQNLFGAFETSTESVKQATK